MINREGKREETAASWPNRSLPSRRVAETKLNTLEALPGCHFPI